MVINDPSGESFQDHSQEIGLSRPLSGYELAVLILDHRRGGVEALLRLTSAHETDWLELKAGMQTASAERKPGEKDSDGHWNVARAVIALANTRGGVVLVGIDDHRKVIGLQACDPRGVLRNEGLEAYLRKEVADRIDPANGTWVTSQGKWRLQDGRLPKHLIDIRAEKLNGMDIAVILVRTASDGCIRVWKDDVEQILIRTLGHVGRVETIIGSQDMQTYESRRSTAGHDLAAIWSRFKKSRCVRIFISSPDDVEEERLRAREVISRLQRAYSSKLMLTSVFWEDLPLPATASFQQGIDLIIGDEYGIDVAVFILWSRLGSRPGPAIMNEDGQEYRSGTERELDLMFKAYEVSQRKRPHILIYIREDEASFLVRLKGVTTEEERKDILRQKEMLSSFVQMEFRDPETGTNTRAYHTFSKPKNFSASLYTHLKACLGDILEEEVEENSWDGEPYLGLEAFRTEHARIFHGREEETDRFLSLMSERCISGARFILLLGPSGVGKTSFLQAGVKPRLNDDLNEMHSSVWHSVLFTPTQAKGRLLEHFLLKLSAEGCLPGVLEDVSLEDMIRSGTKDLQTVIDLKIKGLLERMSERSGGLHGVLVIVDQFEEVFTEYTREEINALADVLATLAESDRFFVIASMRNDHYPRFLENDHLASLRGDLGQFDLRPPEMDMITRMIKIPARMAGYKFERDEKGVSLDKRIRDDFNKERNALPLLEYVLTELAKRSGEGKLLTFEDYMSVGSLQGAIGKRAEETYIKQVHKKDMGSVFQSLVTISARLPERALRRKALISDFDNSTEAKALIGAFVKERLFVVDGDYISVTHEAIFTHWDRYRQWIEQNREALAIRKDVEGSFNRWEQKDRHRDYLINGAKPVGDAKHLMAKHPELLTNELRQYITRSMRKAESAKRTWVWAACLLAVVTIAMANFAYSSKNAHLRALQEERRAEELAENALADLNLITEMLVPLIYHAYHLTTDYTLILLVNDFLDHTRGVFTPTYYPYSISDSYNSAMLCDFFAKSVLYDESFTNHLLYDMPLVSDDARSLEEALLYVDQMKMILMQIRGHSDFPLFLEEKGMEYQEYMLVLDEVKLLYGIIDIYSGRFDEAVESLQTFITSCELMIPESSSYFEPTIHYDLMEAYSSLSHALRLSGRLKEARISALRCVEHGRNAADLVVEFSERALLRAIVLELHELIAPDTVEVILGYSSEDLSRYRVILESIIPLYSIESIDCDDSNDQTGLLTGDILLGCGDWRYYTEAFPRGRYLEVGDYSAYNDDTLDIIVYRGKRIIELNLPAAIFVGYDVVQSDVKRRETIRYVYTNYINRRPEKLPIDEEQ